MESVWKQARKNRRSTSPSSPPRHLPYLHPVILILPDHIPVWDGSNLGREKESTFGAGINKVLICVSFADKKVGEEKAKELLVYTSGTLKIHLLSVVERDRDTLCQSKG
ncbi:unnamed protein product [Allacma fusca]|uniref:Uncharacterized protein n=1 Tax=Allacma fusca TaxID=39272 RepID=A0A8J2LLT3_9HEXA|nr:unnamed protein product [Allacma fusca]